jgi:hypothetical protein
MSLADQLLIVNTRMKKYLVLGIGKNIVGSASIIVASFWGVKAIAWSYFIYHALFFVPFCYYSFTSLNDRTNLVSQMLKETILVVTTAIIAVVVPWLLTYQKILNPQISMLLFVFFCWIIYHLIWKQVNFFEPVVFIKSVFKRRKPLINKSSRIATELSSIESL